MYTCIQYSVCFSAEQCSVFLNVPHRDPPALLSVFHLVPILLFLLFVVQVHNVLDTCLSWMNLQPIPVIQITWGQHTAKCIRGRTSTCEHSCRCISSTVWCSNGSRNTAQSLTHFEWKKEKLFAAVQVQQHILRSLFLLFVSSAWSYEDGWDIQGFIYLILQAQWLYCAVYDL